MEKESTHHFEFIGLLPVKYCFCLVFFNYQFLRGSIEPEDKERPSEFSILLRLDLDLSLFYEV